MTGIPKRVRPHHWGFANGWLENSFQRIPETIVAAIARAGSAEPVADSWNNFAKTLEPEDRHPADELGAASYRARTERGEWFLAVVEFPPPKHPGEAYFAALAVAPDGGQLRPDLEEDQPREGTRTRYFLLERSDNSAPELWEWNGDERNRVQTSSGAPPDAEESAFVRAVIDFLDGSDDID